MSRSLNIKVIKCLCIITVLFVFGAVLYHLFREQGEDYLHAKAVVRVDHSGSQFEAETNIIIYEIDDSTEKPESEPPGVEFPYVDIPGDSKIPKFNTKIPSIQLPTPKFPKLPLIDFSQLKVAILDFLDWILALIVDWILTPLIDCINYILSIDFWGPVKALIVRSKRDLLVFFENIRINLCSFVEKIHFLVDSMEVWIKCNLSKDPSFSWGTTFLANYLRGLEDLEKKAEQMGILRSGSQVAYSHVYNLCILAL